MKKTLIALSVLVAAGSVNAATVYENEGFAAEVYGDIAVHYEQAQGEGTAATNTKEAKITIDDADFGFNVSSAVNDELTVIANADFSGESTVTLDDLTVGIKTATTTVKVGDQVNLVDDFGISNDKAFGLATAEDLADDGDLVAAGAQVIRIDYDSGEMFYAALASTQEVDDNPATQDGSQLDLMAGARFGDADVSLTYSTADFDTANEVDFIGLAASYSIDAVTLKAVYTTVDQDAATSSDVDAFGANVEYVMGKTTFNLGAVDVDFDLAGEEDYTEFYANVIYSLAANTALFAEIQDSDASESDMGYAVGLTVNF